MILKRLTNIFNASICTLLAVHMLAKNIYKYYLIIIIVKFFLYLIELFQQ